MVTKGSTVYAACITDDGVRVEEAVVAAVGKNTIRIEDGSEAFHWRRLFEHGVPGISETRLAALEELRRDLVVEVHAAEEILRRARGELALVQVALDEEKIRS